MSTPTPAEFNLPLPTSDPATWVGPPPYAGPAIAFDPLAQLDDEQKAKVAELRSQLPKLSASQTAWCDDMTLIRYLRARDYNVKKALTLLKKTLTWRADFKPHRLSPSDIEPEAVTGKVYRNGYDKFGHPVIYMRSGRENTNTYERQIQHLVYHLERAVASMPPGISQFTFIIDYNGFSMSKSPPFHVSKKVLSILSDCYPERLFRAFLVDAPFYFSGFWTMITPFLNKVQKAKIVFVKGKDEKGSKKHQTLTEVVDDSVLEKQFAGDNVWEYDHSVYWAQEQKIWEQVKPTYGEEEDQVTERVEEDVQVPE